MFSSKRSKVRTISDSVNVNPKRRKIGNEESVDTKANVLITCDVISTDIAEQLLAVEHNLTIELGKIKFHMPIEYVYNPLEYAFNTHSMYVHKYCTTVKKVIFLGMNPGPWGMCQTGVPFGEVTMVRDWLKICGPVGKPAKEQPDRKINGFQCTRSEISGKRLWSLFQELCGTPEKFFQQAYIDNYCPIALMDKKGRNVTPAEIKGTEQQMLHNACDQALRDTIKILKPEIIIGIGGYAEKRVQVIVQSLKLPIKVLCLPHPSPRALNNKNWGEKATKKLQEFGLLEILTA